MTVGELIEKLKDFDSQADIRMSDGIWIMNFLDVRQVGNIVEIYHAYIGAKELRYFDYRCRDGVMRKTKQYLKELLEAKEE